MPDQRLAKARVGYEDYVYRMPKPILITCTICGECEEVWPNQVYRLHSHVEFPPQ